ncbi:hypothetical protein SCP_0209180 [Sparassis crispa]|uniref:Uncharacterized protein n=1 Tax=Sparassis crispa TaxID=139825 RepID=A0A401GC34_9APHY|nr:hypothetical protein SCP_0209180 [Sparassis crispa]GBE79717.1 hypothetical protein SCP_0209180 [Sparassis crispa]
MRRLAAVFAAKRTDRSDAASSVADDSPAAPPSQQLSKPRSRFFRSLSRKAAPPAQSLVVSDHTPSSSSSSSAGPSTPDDDGTSSFRAAASRKNWLAWHHDTPPAPQYISAPTPTSRSVPPASPRHGSEEDLSSDESSGTEPEQPLSPTVVAPQRPRICLTPSSSDHSHSSARSGPLSPTAYVRALTVNALLSAFSPPPLLHVPNTPLFPRSCNLRRTLPPLSADPVCPSMLRRHLLRRLDRARTLAPSEQYSLAPFASRRGHPTAASHRGPSRNSVQTIDDVAVSDGKRIGMHSDGLRLWAERPCFEDRMVVYLPAHPGSVQNVVCIPVSGPGLGVAAIEFSETLELLAGLYDPDAEVAATAEAEDANVLPAWLLDVTLTPPLSLSSSATPESSGPTTPTSTSPMPSPVLSGSSKPPELSVTLPSPPPRGQLYKAAPSPLRIEHSQVLFSIPPTSPRRTASPAAPTPTVSPSPSSSTGTSVTVKPSSPVHTKPNVRFAESVPADAPGMDAYRTDNIPLGYVQRIKHQRAEKARFLAVERARRDEAVRAEEQRRRREAERRALEEERKKRLYAEEVARARARRESMRVDPDWEIAREKERERRGREVRPVLARPAYDAQPAPAPRRQGSAEPNVRRDESPAQRSAVAGSRSSSVRPASINGSAAAEHGSPAAAAATRSSSSPDVRHGQGQGRPNASRRGSMVSDAGSRPSPAPPGSPAWMSSPNGSPRMNPRLSMNMGVPSMPMQMVQVPMPMQMVPVPVPVAMPYALPMGMYGMSAGMMMDAPLLPPSPPFMVHQFGYRAPSPAQGPSSQSRDHSRSRAHSSSPAPGPRDHAHSSSPAPGHRDHAHSSSPAPGHRDHAPSPSRSPQPQPQNRSHSSSPRQAAALLSPHTQQRSPMSPAQAPSPSSSAPRAHHQRRSSADVDVHRSAQPPPQSSDRRSTKSSAPRPAPTHHASLPPSVPPMPRSTRAQDGFQILSRPSAGRRQTMIS